MILRKTKYLLVKFDQTLQSYDIPKFRSAVIEKTKRQSALFHNHIGDAEFMYRYPLIQYKIIDRKPAIICLNQATDDIHFLLKEKDFNFRIGSNHYAMEIEEARLKYETLASNELNTYNIRHWIALNQDNYPRYRKLSRLVDKIQFLEDILHAHTNIFLEEILEGEKYPLHIEIIDINEEKNIEYKGIFHLTFSLDFRTNLNIPEYIGIGKGVSVGFGSVKKVNEHKKLTKNQEHVCIKN